MNLTRINSVQSTLFGISHVRFNGRYMKSKRKYSFDLALKRSVENVHMYN